MPNSSLTLTRSQILAFRRRVGALDERLPNRARSLERAAWAGLQDSMPRAALLSIHARVERTRASSWEDPALIQLWGPRYHAYVVARRDLGIFSLGRLPEDGRVRRNAEDLAGRLHALLNGSKMTDREAGRVLGENHNRLRYAALTGRVIIRWEGSRAPTIWTLPQSELEPRDARLELARRYLHVFGPTTPAAFAQWAGIAVREGITVFNTLHKSLTRVQTPLGEAWILSRDEPAYRAEAQPAAPARLLPSGDAYFLLQGADRELLVPEAKHRETLWTPRVWPGAVLVEGEIVGVWRRAGEHVTIGVWKPITRAAREAVEAEATGLPLPDMRGPIVLSWDG
jgi:winged helix DNA-binding protein